MGGRVVTGEHFVEGKHRAEVEIGLLIELAINLVHVAIELFEQALKAVEHSVESSLVAGKICANEFLERGGITVIRAPEFGNLMQALFNPGRLLASVFGR